MQKLSPSFCLLSIFDIECKVHILYSFDGIIFILLTIQEMLAGLPLIAPQHKSLASMSWPKIWISIFFVHLEQFFDNRLLNSSIS